MPDDLTWTAQPVPPEKRHEVYKEQRSFEAIDRRRNRISARWAWAIAGLCALATLASNGMLAVVLLRQHPAEPLYIFADSATGGAVVAVPAREAIARFGTPEAIDDLTKYITARLGYVDVLDHEQWATVRAMSEPEQFIEYDAWRKSSLSPKNQLGTNGHVVIEPNWQMDPHPIRAPDGVLSHTVTIRMRQVKGTQIGPTETWRVTTSFRWNLDLRLQPDDAVRNPHKFQAITFEAHKL